MPIQCLSDNTRRVLTSAQTLNDAVSVIKELVDNALDAQASSISIEIAANTLDKFVVRDDGTGIGVEDRQWLCKRGCTSKIANLDDLAELGGKCLGFRGTALASIAELSKEVAIISKVDGEQSATILTFGPNGSLISSASTSHNVGTTVRVEKFLASIPVRRQFVLKSMSKILDQIKKLLQGYAFARPAVKSSMKVLKAKNDKANWSFAAVKDGNSLVSAAIQVAGKATSDLSKYYVFPPDKHDKHYDGYRIEALLLQAEKTDISKSGNLGQYISVDGRPVSQDKGIMKELVKRYKLYLHKTRNDDVRVPSKPFLVIRLHCPDASYDVNVEPTKDVVLFHTESKVLNLAEELFREVYGELGQQEVYGNSKQCKVPKKADSTSFDTLLARRGRDVEPRPEETEMETELSETANMSPSPDENVNSDETLVEGFLTAVKYATKPPRFGHNEVDQPNGTEIATRPRSHRNMYAIDDEPERSTLPLDRQHHDFEEEQEERYDPEDIAVNNPFVRAKINSLRRPTPQNIVDPPPSNQTSPSLSRSKPLSTTNTPLRSRISLGLLNHLPTPEKSPGFISDISYQNPGPPFPRRAKHTGDSEEENSHSELEDSAQLRQSFRNQSTLGAWVKHSASTTQFSSSANTGSSELPTALETASRPRARVENASEPHLVTNCQFESPLETSQPEVAALLPGIPYVDIGNTEAVSPIAAHRSFENPWQTDEDLRQILDFEKRKKKVNQQQRRNQAILKADSLVRTQQSSQLNHEPANALETRRAFEQTAIDKPFALIGVDRDAVETVHENQRKILEGPSPHKSRYLAALRALEQKRKDHLASDIATAEDGELYPDTNGSFKKTDRSPSIPPADPRACLISLQRYYATHPKKSDLKAQRTKSYRLPFEAIPLDAVKHDLRVTPAKPFPSGGDLQVECKALSKRDSYVRKGKIATTTWSPASNEVEQWQRRIETLIKKNYRAKISINRESDNEEHIAPNIKIPLARVIHAHISSI